MKLKKQKKLNHYTFLLCSALLVTQVSATTIINNVYTEKGLAGSMSQTQVDKNTYTSKTQFGWNNRRVNISETISLGENGIPVSFTTHGTSAFGAPISEKFEYNKGIATWQDTDEKGSIKDDTVNFYVAKNSSLILENARLRYLIKTGKTQADVYPQGQVQVRKLLTRKLKNEDIHLYVTSGLALTPDFAWYDNNGNYFAQSWGGGMYVLRKGVPQSEFATLRKLQKEQEQTYLEDLSASLTHTHQSLLIKDVAVLDVEQGVVTSGQHVLLRDGKIKRISNEPIQVNGIATVNGSGKTLIPGLWDMHGHLSKENGILNIANGVISVRDMGNEHKNIMEIESLFDTNRVLGTRVYRAGFMDKLSENSAGLSVETLEEALNTVDFFADNGYVQIKLYSSIDPTWVKPIADRAHNRGLRLSGHVPAFMTAEQAINAGYDEIQHINMLFLNFLAGQDVDTRTTKRFSLIGEQATELPLDTDEMTAFIKLLADKKIVVDATVSTFRSLLMAENEKVNPEYAHLIDHMPVSFVRQMKGAAMHVEDIHKINYQRSGEAMQNMLKKLYDAGVNIVPGTDNVAGFTLIRELELYALAGIPTAEVMKMATINSAKLMGVAHKTGSIDENKTADLVLVEGDPLVNIKALRKPSLIIKGEQVFKPEQIYNAIGVKPFVPASEITH